MTGKPTRPLVASRSTALYLGLLAWGVGSVLLWDAYGHRGHSPPWALKIASVFAPI